MSLFKIKLDSKRSRKLESKTDNIFGEINTCVLVDNNEVLDTIGTREKQTVARLDSNITKDYLFNALYDLDYIEDYAWKGFPEQRKIAESNKQDWIDDLYLKSLGIIYTNYVSNKYGFDCYNRKTGELIRGKTALNKVIKRLHSVSGTRINFLSKGIILRGVQHYKKIGKSKFDYDKHLNQYEYVKNLPRNSAERRLYIPSEWIDSLINDIVAIESKYVYQDNKGNEYVNKQAVKEDLKSLLDYPKYKEHKDKLLEIIENFKIDDKKCLKLKLH